MHEPVFELRLSSYRHPPPRFSRRDDGAGEDELVLRLDGHNLIFLDNTSERIMLYLHCPVTHT